MLTNFNAILKDAYEKKYAVGSFNFYNYESLRGILNAGKEANAPLIVSFGKKYLTNMTLDEAAALTNAAASSNALPVCLHLDHCNDLNVIYRAIRSGFTSVMYDGSALRFEENLKNTKLVCEIAHASGVSVEAELGSLAAGENSHEGEKTDKEIYTDPIMAKQFVEETKVDALAVSIGTVHGLYKGTPNVRVDILKEINKECNTPLVLHGGSGTPEKTIRECIANGITKINVNTEISDYTIQNTRELLNNQNPHFSVLSIKQQEFVKDVTMKYIEMFR